MDKITALFREHPASVGETYLEHMGMAASFAFAMLGAGIACLVHAFLPFLFTRTGRTTIESLYVRMVTHRDRRLGALASPGSGLASTHPESTQAR